MADENASNGSLSEGNTADPLSNLKAEVDRKISNVGNQVSQLAETNKALLAQLQAIAATNAPKAQPQEDNFEDLWYKDPKQAAARIRQETEASIEEKLNRRQAETTRQNQTISQLVKEYPELNDENNDLTVKAVQIYNSMDEAEKRSPMAYKLAVKEAASELDLKPISKRAQNGIDSYTMPSYGQGPNSQSGKGVKRGELAPETVAFAKLVGLNTEDPKVMESLKNRAQRKNWNKYE